MNSNAMSNTLRKANWHIESRKSVGRVIFICCRAVDWDHPNVIDCFDTKEFSSKNDAVRRCRELNAQLVSGWMPDSHPQNW